MAVVEHETSIAYRPLPTVLHEWVTTVDHKRLGILYLLTAVVFLVFAGVEAVLMRLQLIKADYHFLGPEAFNQIFTMHGTTMIFFVAMPLLTGFGNYVVPLMIGARDMAFPRLNAFGYWMFLFGGVILYYSFIAGGAPNVGWFAYAPLTEYTYSRGHNTDYWVLGILVSGIGTVGGAVNMIATILCLRAPGMALGKVPLFVWMMLWTNILILVAFPPLTAAQIMLLFDRSLGALFFDTQAGGSAVLWQHLFWFFGHPEVYILILPAFGIISEVVPVFSRKVIFGYESVAAATTAIGFISLGVWAHHMFAVGMSRTLDIFFAGATLLIAVPTGIKMFNWIATLYGGKLRLDSPMLFALGFLAMFLIGGLTGIMLAAIPFDWQATDTYFVVGHFHFVAFGGTLFALTAGAYYWFPKMTGKMLDERLACWHFWLLFIGFNLTFIPMHFAGLLGMPRRIYTYPADRGWDIWNQITSAGTFVQGLAFAIFFWNLIVSLRNGKPAGDDPWDAWTLEWATTSPPAVYNFETVPVVLSRRPLWDLKHPEDPDWLFEHPHEDIRAVRPKETLPHSMAPRVAMICFLVTEFAFFSTLIVTYALFIGKSVTGPRPSEVFWKNAVSTFVTLGSTACLLASSGTIHLAASALRQGKQQLFRTWLGVTILLGAIFLAGTASEWHDLIVKEGLTLSRNLFGTTYFTLVGFHAAHVTIGLILMSVLLGLAARGHITEHREQNVELVSWYWHFVDVVWIVVFTLVYVVGR